MLIQEQALRLFRDQGYELTTIEQIAEAAEVSPSTIFRYFPTKPDLVIYDDIDQLLIDAYRAQPPEMSPVQALHAVLLSSFGRLISENLDLQLQRAHLMRSVPELRATMLDEFVRLTHEISILISERTGRLSDDDTILALAGAAIGVVITAWLATDNWIEHFLERIDKGLELLDSGLRL